MEKKTAKKYDKGKGSLGGNSEDKLNESYVADYVMKCLSEAEQARSKRMIRNRENYDVYHLEYSGVAKGKGQSDEALPKVKMATEQTKAFFQQALADLTEFWKLVRKDREQDSPADVITADEMQTMVNYMLKRADYYSHVGNSVWYALLGSLAVTQVTGKLTPKPKFKSKEEGRGTNYRKYIEMTEDKTWELSFNEIRQANYYPDPTGRGLYEIFDSYVDKYHVFAAAEGDYAIYDRAAVDELEDYGPTGGQDEAGNNGPMKSQETGQTPDNDTFRPAVRLTRFYGNIIDDETGKLLYENCFVTIANGKTVIQKPTPNPLWHQGTDIVAAPLLTVPGSVWHTALMDSPSRLNIALNELTNMMFDAGYISTHGIKQVRKDWLEDVSEISDGIPYGKTLSINERAPVGGKVLEDIVVGQFPQQVFNVANMMQQEYNAAALTTDLRGGITPMRQQSATAVVEQGNTITSVFQGVAKNVEEKLVTKELELSTYQTAQNWDLIDKEIFISLYGKERGEKLSQLAPEDVFVAVVNGMRFEVYGITLTINQKLEYQKYMTFLQSVGASPLFQEAFLSQYDPAKLLGELAGTLGIDKKKIQNKQAGLPQVGPEGAAPQPDQMSQVPQAGADNSLASIFGAGGGPQPAEGQLG